MTSKSEQRLMGADTGFCPACSGFNVSHNDWCDQEDFTPPPTKASLLTDEQVEEMENQK